MKNVNIEDIFEELLRSLQKIINKNKIKFSSDYELVPNFVQFPSSISTGKSSQLLSTHFIIMIDKNTYESHFFPLNRLMPSIYIEDKDTNK
jgi:hypothetical protein